MKMFLILCVFTLYWHSSVALTEHLEHVQRYSNTSHIRKYAFSKTKGRALNGLWSAENKDNFYMRKEWKAFN